MKNSKRIIALLLSMLLVAFTAGCASGSSSGDSSGSAAQQEEPASPAASGETPAESPAATSAEPTIFSLWTFVDVHENYFEACEDLWNEKNPDRPIDVQCEIYGFDDMNNKMLIALQSGVGAPDFADCEVKFFANYSNGGYLMPLNDYVEPYKDSLSQSRVDMYTVDGNFYGVDYLLGATGVYYNTEILKQAGVDYKSIITWDDFIAAGKEVTSKTDSDFFVAEYSDYNTFYALLQQRGGDFFDKDGNVTLDNDIAIGALQFLYDLIYTEGVASLCPQGWLHAEEAYSYLSSNGAAAIIVPVWYMARYEAYMPELAGKIKFMPMPQNAEGPNYTPAIGGTATCVTNQCENPELAAEFICFAKGSDEGAILDWTMLAFEPINLDVYSMPEFQVENSFTDYFGKDLYDTLTTIKDNVTSPNNVGSSLYPRACQLVLSDVLYNSISASASMTPEEALRAAAEELRNL